MQRLLSVYKFGDMVKWVEDIYSLLYFISGMIQAGSRPSMLIRGAVPFAGYFYYANAVVNPILYTMHSQRIRRGLMSSFRQRSFINHGSTYFLNGMMDNDFTQSVYNSYPPSLFALRKSVMSVVLVATNAGKHSRTAVVRQESVFRKRGAGVAFNSTVRETKLRRFGSSPVGRTHVTADLV